MPSFPATAAVQAPAATGPQSSPFPSPETATALTAFGVPLRESGDSAVVLAPLSGSPAAALGLAPQDRLAFLNADRIHSPADAARAWLGWSPDMRLGAVVRRALRTVALKSQLTDEEPAFLRGPQELSPHEQELKAARLTQAFRTASLTVSQAPPLQVGIPARQLFWIRFPAGIPATVATGDILEGN